MRHGPGFKKLAAITNSGSNTEKYYESALTHWAAPETKNVENAHEAAVGRMLSTRQPQRWATRSSSGISHWAHSGGAHVQTRVSIHRYWPAC